MLTGLFLVLVITCSAQETEVRNIGNRIQQRVGGLRRNVGSSGTADSLRRRDKHEDSISIYFRYADSTGMYLLDSSVTDFCNRYPVPATHVYLGNTGLASRSILFQPARQSGFDPGLHAFDVYKWNMEQVRFFQTTRPYSEINYLLGSRVEQIIEVMHTQNIRPAWNVSFRYRLINSPGFFQNQQTNHNNYLITSRYQSRTQRYTNYFVLLGNKLQAAENGGIIDTTGILDDPVYKERYNITTYLGGVNPFSSNFFSTRMNTGNKYNEFSILLRQQYDFGRKDSIVTDSTITPLFYPQVRLEHTIRYDKLDYTFLDNAADSMYYQLRYDTTLSRYKDSLLLIDRWQLISNDFSVYTFPDAMNQHQFLKAGLSLQYYHGRFGGGSHAFLNTAGHAEYRNLTRNKVWEMEAKGQLFFTGYNKGDFDAFISLQRMLGKKAGYLKLGFENSNRMPAFLFDSRSSFYFSQPSVSLKKENSTHLFTSYFVPGLRLRLSGDYFLLTNYLYLQDYYMIKQEPALFNVLRVTVQKTFRLAKHWNWHSEIFLQQQVGNAPVHMPWFYTRNRIAYEGNLGFKNLDIAMGAEIRYRPPYKADYYSPVHGRFFLQDSHTIRNRVPDISAYVHFRIRPFKAFIRAENLNTWRKLPGQGFGFTNNNLVTTGYAMPGLQIKLGVYWSFVN